jgi:N-acetylglucosaminyldiphosphoundecaprenol N-acetyl-beta-D-mannosaminyltransferase
MNLHGLYVYISDPAFRTLNRRSVPVIDGTPIVWLAKLLGLPVEQKHRVAWIDLIDPLLEAATTRGWRVFYLGSKSEVISAGLAEIRRIYPALAIEGHHGYLSPESAYRVQKRVQAFAPDILIVGMGMSVQEKWILDNERALHVPVIATAGACIEYVANAVRTPPRWLGAWGLEWLYRLATDPMRFWHRYLVEPWVVLIFLAARGLGKHQS